MFTLLQRVSYNVMGLCIKVYDLYVSTKEMLLYVLPAVCAFSLCLWHRRLKSDGGEKMSVTVVFILVPIFRCVLMVMCISSVLWLE